MLLRRVITHRFRARSHRGGTARLPCSPLTLNGKFICKATSPHAAAPKPGWSLVIRVTVDICQGLKNSALPRSCFPKAGGCSSRFRFLWEYRYFLNEPLRSGRWPPLCCRVNAGYLGRNTGPASWQARGFGAFYLLHPSPWGSDLGAAVQVSDSRAARFNSLFPAAWVLLLNRKLGCRAPVQSALQGALEDARAPSGRWTISHK